MKFLHQFKRATGLFIIIIVAVSLSSCSKQKEEATHMQRDRMIIDQLQYAEHYMDMNPGFKIAFEFLRQENLADLPPERYELDSTKVFAMIAKAKGKTRADSKLEAHKKYIDIQYVISGDEEMGWKRADKCKDIDTPYSEEKDIMFFADEITSWNKVPPGSFAIFFPNDAHAPMVGDGEIHKVVIKVAIEQ